MTDSSGTERRVGPMLLGASLVAGLAGYAVLVVVARSISITDYADFLTFWAVMFLGFGILGGVQADVTRAVTTTNTTGTASTGPRLLVVAVSIAVVTGLFLVATAAVWSPSLFERSSTTFVAIVALGIVGFAGHSTVAGILAGHRMWRHFAFLVGGESALRLVLVASISRLGGGVEWIAFATAVASLAWTFGVVSSADVRAIIGARSDRPLGPTLLGWLHVAAAAAATATLVVGFPVLVRVASTSAEYVASAALLLAVMLTRAPILLPLGVLQNLAIETFVRSPDRAPRLMARAAGGAVVVAAVGGAVAAVVGPPVLRAVQPGFVVAPMAFAGLTVAACMIGLLMMTGAWVLASNLHRAYATGWLAAAFAALALLEFGAGDMTQRIVSSLALAPLAGLAIHLYAVRRYRRGTLTRLAVEPASRVVPRV